MYVHARLITTALAGLRCVGFTLLFGLLANGALVSEASAQQGNGACRYDLFSKQFVSDAYELTDIKLLAQFGGQADCRATVALKPEVQNLLPRYFNAAQFVASSNDQECIRFEYERIITNSGFQIDYRVSEDGRVVVRQSTGVNVLGFIGESNLELLKSGKLSYRDDTLLQMSRYDDDRLLKSLLEACRRKLGGTPSTQSGDVQDPAILKTATQIRQCVNMPPNTPPEDLAGWFIQLSFDNGGGVSSIQGLAPNDVLWRAIQRAIPRCGPYADLKGRRDVAIDVGLIFRE